MAEKTPTKKQKIVKIFAISVVILSIVMSSIALYVVSDIKEKKDGNDGRTSLTKTSTLYGTNGCENGGFSIQSGIDENRNGVLENEEVSEIKNICHGTEGPPGPMGNRGYWGYNGTNGIDGTNGTDGEIGVSSFIDSFVGPYGPCSSAAIIEMGNNSSSMIVDSRIKICFENLTKGRLTDIHENSGNSFSTGCNGGSANGGLFLFATVRDGNCLLYKIEDGVVSQVSDDVNFLPGSILGFTVHKNRIWFDADDGSGTQIWSSDGKTMWRETNLTSGIQPGTEMINTGNEIVVSHSSGLLLIGDSDTYLSGNYWNLTYANGILIYNSVDGMYVDGSIFNAEIHSDAVFHEGYLWFIATSDSNGPQLHRSDVSSIEKLTTQLQFNSGNVIGPSVIGQNIVFDSGGIVSYNTSSSSLQELNSTIQLAGTGSDWIIFQDKIWFPCAVASIGFELCVSDGLESWLHFDYNPGVSSSNPTNFAILQDNLVMLVEQSSEGGQLAVVTENSIELLWDHNPGDFASGIHGDLWVGDELLFFIGDDSQTGLEMYGWAHGELSDEWIVIH